MGPLAGRGKPLIAGASRPNWPRHKQSSDAWNGRKERRVIGRRLQKIEHRLRLGYRIYEDINL